MATSKVTDLFSLDGKLALVTGSSSGIGQAQAVALAAAGAVVGVNGTQPDKIADTLRQIEEVGGKGVALPATLGTVAACEDLIARTKSELGGLDILINCAGTSKRKLILETMEEDYDFLMNLNLKSLYFLSKMAVPLMIERGGGKILHIGSMTTYRGLGMLSVYGATKAATGLLAQTMANEWARYNIQVNCLAPGFIETPLTAVGVFKDEYRLKWIMDRVPAKRPGYPADLVGATLFFCSAASDFTTGQTLAVDGGFLTGGSFEKPEGE